MKFSYKFSNLLGTIYRKGNLIFTPDGNSVISPVGNRITIYDLKNNKARTLSLESKYNYTSISLSPNGCLLLAVNEQGDTQLISLVCCSVIHKHKFNTAVQCTRFSPDGKHFAIAKENSIYVFKSPGEMTGEYNSFAVEKQFYGAYDDITWIDWSSDSRFLAIGSRDNSTRIVAMRFYKNFRTFTLGGHTDSIVGCFFEKDSLDVNTISRNGQLCIWECSLQLKDFDANLSQESEPSIKRTKNVADSDSEDDIAKKDELEPTDPDQIEKDTLNQDVDKKQHPFYYKKLGRHYLVNEARKDNPKAYVTTATYHQSTKIFVIAFSSGSFYLYELPDVNMIHSLSISDYAITTACFNNTGDWLAMAASGVGQLLVWEWQSEQYIMKQQGHSSEMNCISYSPDGQYIATGGEDSKVKLWNVQNGFCFVTFSEHSSGVTGLQFSNNKKFLVSSSLDGTVRAYDIIRYRNFRTFTSPRPVQFSCVALDVSGEFVVAGGQDVFEIYLWSMKLGKLLEVLSGHEGPVSSLAFSPIATSSTLVSGSWDKTIRIWNCIESSGDHETIEMLADVACVAFKPNGEEIAVSTINGNISIFSTKTSTQISSIEGRNDLGSGVSEVDLITAKKNLEGRYFSSITYSADGDCILAGGKSKNVCIYNVREGILMKKFEITQNHSLDGLDDFINRRNITEFGNMALVEERESLEGGNVALRLPGVQKGDMASRNFKPEVKVFSLRFSPTGLAWAAASTEGLLIYSLDKGVVFDPFNLSMEVTPKSTRECLDKEEFSTAVIMALKLNESALIQEVIEKIPSKEIDLVSSSFPNEYAHRALQNVSKLLQSTPHVEFYLKWACCLLQHHGIKENVFQHHSLLALHESLSKKYETLSKICDYNKYTIRVLRSLPVTNDTANTESNDGEIAENDDDMILVKSNDHEHISRTDSDMSSMENITDSD